MVIAVDGMTGDARAAVAELLELRGQPIVLVPATGDRVQKPGGGYDYSDATPRPPQVLAKFDKGVLDGEEQSQTDRSTVRQLQFEVVGAFDAVIELGDSWEEEAAKYEIVHVDRTRPYQITAQAIGWLKVTGHSG